MTFSPPQPPPLEPLDSSEEVVSHTWKPLREIAKYSAAVLIMVVACLLMREKLAKIKWSEFVLGLESIAPIWLCAAVAITAVNYVVLTGYDFIAVRYLKKQLPIRRIMVGAVVGYAMSNVFGWIFGGTAVRYRLYTSWGFTFREVVAFVSILSLTFWLGMFLLAGVAFVALEVHLPPQFAEHAIFPPRVWGWVFLAAVAGYLTACAFWRKPIRWGHDEFQLPPLALSSQQLLVSACDFALASAALYVLLPPGIANFSTVLVAYLAGMILTVITHVPGGIGVLDATLLYMLHAEEDSPQLPRIAAAVVVFRVIYYFLPAIVAAGLLFWNEVEMRAPPTGKGLAKPAA
jgi:uncharacterized membrane protein YbhN (UPF0104 family)